MFQKNQMVNVRKVIEKTYTDTCTVTEYKEDKQNGVVSFNEVDTYVDQPCRLSFNNSPATTQSDSVDIGTQNIKVFISPDLSIKKGSKLTITRENDIFIYKCSSEPKKFVTHQEIELILFKGWS